MKLLLFQAADFRYSPESLDDLPESADGPRLVAFVHGEAGDEARDDLQRKAAKQIKWLANKRDLRRLCLHSFAHLAETRAEATWTRNFLEELAERLRGNGYEVETTPFGESCAWQLSVFQPTLAKVFKSL